MCHLASFNFDPWGCYKFDIECFCVYIAHQFQSSWCPVRGRPGPVRLLSALCRWLSFHRMFFTLFPCGSPFFAVWLDLGCPDNHLPGCLTECPAPSPPHPTPSTCSAFSLWVSFTPWGLVLPQSSCSYVLAFLFWFTGLTRALVHSVLATRPPWSARTWGLVCWCPDPSGPCSQRLPWLPLYPAFFPYFALSLRRPLASV